jgi:hypothetical protein
MRNKECVDSHSTFQKARHAAEAPRDAQRERKDAFSMIVKVLYFKEITLQGMMVT